MITLFRWYRMKAKEIKWKLAVYQLLDQQLTDLMKDPEIIARKSMPYLAELIHNGGQSSAMK